MNTFTSWDAELYHHGIKGQKWGIRRFQNPDGTLTAEGIKRYGHSFGESLMGPKKNGSVGSNATPEKLGYTPMKGKKGTGFQRDIAQQQIAAERKASKLSYKASNEFNEKKRARLAKRASKFVNSAEIFRAMQKRYNDLGPFEQRSIERARKSAMMTRVLFGPVVGAIGSAKYISDLNKFQKNTVEDMRHNPKKYRD